MRTFAIVLLHLTGLACAVIAVMQTRTPPSAIARAVSLIAFPYLAVPRYLVYTEHGARRLRVRLAWLTAPVQ